VPPSDQFQNLQPSLVDRLAPDSDIAAEIKLVDGLGNFDFDRYGYSLPYIMAAVRRDLEALLNTRRPPLYATGSDGRPAVGQDGKPELFFGGLEEVPTSIANFGLPDLSYFDTLTADVRDRFAAHIKEVIEAFEPRLKEVHVGVRDAEQVAEAMRADYKRTALYFHIEAKLNLDPAPEVSFETVLELTKGTHQVMQGG
jgi:type VI secretion system protein ImpF